VRITLIGPAFPWRGGIPLLTNELAHRLTACGHTVRIRTWTRQGPARLLPAQLHPLSAPEAELFPTIRRFPNAVRAVFEALGSERSPFRASWLGERELDLGRYEHEIACDWTSGSFLLVRREALESAGLFDERFFIYSEETDLCLRIKAAGWEIRHLPTMTILHHAQKAGANPKMEAQLAFAGLQYAR
jgi:hypothetical protein